MRWNDLRNTRNRNRGFTLIELLIVIAIILILIAIALPNFLEAQIRARVTKAKAEIRSLSIALESYAIDFRVYPPEHERNSNNRYRRGLFWLTSPISYMTSIPGDPFSVFGADDNPGRGLITYEMGGIEVVGDDMAFFQSEKCPSCLLTYVMFSNGPDVLQDINAANPHFGQIVNNYSPTNGTKSGGSIYYWGGDSFWIGVPIDSRFGYQSIPNPAQNVTLSPNLVDGVSTVKKLPRY